MRSIQMSMSETPRTPIITAVSAGILATNACAWSALGTGAPSSSRSLPKPALRRKGGHGTRTRAQT